MSKKDAPKESEAPEAAAPVAQPAPEAGAPDYYEQLLRLKAEFENFRKRVDREKPELVRYGREQILTKLLPLYDVLAQAHEEIARQNATAAGSEGLKSLAKGMELIFKEFEKLFASEGMKPFEASGKPYDHAWHDVVGTVERADLPEGTVVDVLQPGFTLDGKVLRHAKVRISRKPATAEAKSDAP